MLTECFFVATQNPSNSSQAGSGSIYLHELQPLSSIKTTYKKSAVNVNCIAYSYSHVFAAQSDKAVVHVYERQSGKQQCLVAFPEKIRSIAVTNPAQDNGVLVLGTESGGLILWELGSGRQVLVPRHHIQAVTCLAVDPSSQIIISASADSSALVWSLIDLLTPAPPTYGLEPQKQKFPYKKLLRHRDDITALKIGNSRSRRNIAVTSSKDQTVIVWDYLNGTALRTFLLSAIPISLGLDPASRAIYAGLEDGSIHFLDFYQVNRQASSEEQALFAQNPIPIQAEEATRWRAVGITSPIDCLGVSFDGTLLLSGHRDGKLHLWDIARGSYKSQVADFQAAITNILMPRPDGFLAPSRPGMIAKSVVRPKYADSIVTDPKTGLLKGLTIQAQLDDLVNTDADEAGQDFQKRLQSPLFSDSEHEEALAEFSSSAAQTVLGPENLSSDSTDMFSQLQTAKQVAENEVAALKKQLRLHQNQEVWKKIRSARKQQRREAQAKQDFQDRSAAMEGANRMSGTDIIMTKPAEDASLSSDSDDLTD